MNAGARRVERRQSAMQALRLTRRRTMAGLGSLLAASAVMGRAGAADFIDPYDYGLSSETEGDQSKAVQAAIDAAVLSGRDLLLPSGEYYVQNLNFAGNMRVIGSSLGTHILSWNDAPIGRVGGGTGFVLDGVSIHGPLDGPALALEESEQATIRN